MSEVNGTLKAKGRTPAQKGGARKLRASGWVPAIAYGAGHEPVHFAVEPTEFIRARRQFGRTHLYQIEVEGGDTLAVLIKDVQVDAFRNELLHIDFWRVDLEKPVTLPVPVEFTGRPQGVVKGGKFRSLRRTVDLTCLPGKTPEKLVLDTSHLDLGDSIRLEHLDLPEGVTPAADDNHAVATLIAPKAGQLEAAAE